MKDRFTLKDARNSLHIDRDSLDEAIIEQATLYQEVSEQLVAAKERKDQAKFKRDRTEAETSQAARKQFKKDKEKFTEGDIREEVALDDDCMEDQNEYAKARSEVESWEVMKEAYSQRSFMIRELARLWAANYYGDTSVSGGAEIKDTVATSNRMKISKDRKRRSGKRSTRKSLD